MCAVSQGDTALKNSIHIYIHPLVSFVRRAKVVELQRHGSMAPWISLEALDLRGKHPEGYTELYIMIQFYEVQHDVQHVEREDIRRRMNFWTGLPMRFYSCPTSKHSLSLKSVAATFCERCMDCQEVSLISSQFGQRFNEYVRVVASVSACQE